jgi:hypothetical protein
MIIMKPFTAAFLSLLLGNAALLAQQTSNIAGLVRDASGAAVAAATVTLTETSTSARRVVTTNALGEYNARSLPVGTYRIEAEKAGFQKLSRDGVVLTTASTLSVDLVLQVGSQSQTVNVTEQVPLLQAQSGEVSTLVDSTQIVNLPLATRNFTSSSC